jgi:L-ribulose-5-phosphate 3-epimerase
LVKYLTAQSSFLRELGIRVVFESDFEPSELARFIDRLDPALFGINYDIGNSAGCGFNPIEEFAAYAARIVNVHVKDRVLGGTTVPLGTGNADFPAVFSLLRKQGYQGNYIMQTARARDDDHAGAMKTYMQQIKSWVSKAA